MTATPADFKAQTDQFDAETQPDAARWWISQTMDEFKKQGATWARVTTHPIMKNLVLVEAWRIRPEDEGEPQFEVPESKEESK